MASNTSKRMAANLMTQKKLGKRRKNLQAQYGSGFESLTKASSAKAAGVPQTYYSEDRSLAVRPAGTGKANSTPSEVRRHNRRVRRYRRRQYGPSPYVSGHQKTQS